MICKGKLTIDHIINKCFKNYLLQGVWFDCKGNTTIHAQKKMHFSYFFYTNFPNAFCSFVCLFHTSTTLSYIKTFHFLSTRHDMADKLLSLARNNNNNSPTMFKQDNTYYYKTSLHITCNWYYYMFWLNIKLMIYGNAKCSNNTLFNRNLLKIALNTITLIPLTIYIDNNQWIT